MDHNLLCKLFVFYCMTLRVSGDYKFLYKINVPTPSVYIVIVGVNT